MQLRWQHIVNAPLVSILQHRAWNTHVSLPPHIILATLVGRFFPMPDHPPVALARWAD